MELTKGEVNAMVHNCNFSSSVIQDALSRRLAEGYRGGHLKQLIYIVSYVAIVMKWCLMCCAVVEGST